MTLGGVSDLHIQAQDDCADAFIAGRMTERRLRAELARLGFRDWEAEDRIEVFRFERSRRRWADAYGALGIALFTACVLFFAWTFRGVP